MPHEGFWCGEGGTVNVARWVAAGIGIGACGGFVAGLLKSRSAEADGLRLTNDYHEQRRWL